MQQSFIFFAEKSKKEDDSEKGQEAETGTIDEQNVQTERKRKKQDRQDSRKEKKKKKKLKQD